MAKQARPRDPVRDEIHADLRLFRRLPGNPGVDRCHFTPALTAYLGRGSQSHAMSALEYLVATHDTDPAGDIATYWATAGGHGVGGDTLDWRLKHLAEQRYIDPRTVLRSSERGADVLAGIIRDQLTNERPWGTLALVEDNNTIYAHLVRIVPETMAVPDPHVYVNDTRVLDLDLDTWEAEEAIPGWVRSTTKLEPIPLTPDKDDPSYLVRITIYWYPPVYPSWTLSCQLQNDHIGKLEVDRGGWAEVGVHAP